MALAKVNDDIAVLMASTMKNFGSLVSLLEAKEREKAALQTRLDTIRAKESTDTPRAFADVYALLAHKDVDTLEFRQKLSGKIRVLVSAINVKLGVTKREGKVRGYQYDRTADVSVQFRNGQTRDFNLLYTGGELQFITP
ncbi:MAG: hypothetical protein FJ271_29695 [Planctomycetes bacterium]|nr:hypothetical protein [Planctomycetota bacterium]